MVCADSVFSFSEVLFRELESRQTALRHLIHYLTENREQRLLLELLRSLPTSVPEPVITWTHLLTVI